MARSGISTAWGWPCRYGEGLWGHGNTVPLPGCSCHLPPPPQALESSSEFYAPRKWDRAQAFSVVYKHDYKQPMAMAQVLPALVGKSYLNAGRRGCAATNRMPRANGCPCLQCRAQSGFQPGADPVGMTLLPTWGVPGAHPAPLPIHSSRHGAVLHHQHAEGLLPLLHLGVCPR